LFFTNVNTPGDYERAITTMGVRTTEPPETSR